MRMSIRSPSHALESPCGESYHPGGRPGRRAATLSALRRVVLFLATALGSLVLLTTAGATARTVQSADGGLAEVVVTLPQPPLAEAIQRHRPPAAAATTHHRLDVGPLASRNYLRTLATAQRTLQARIQTAIPS